MSKVHMLSFGNVFVFVVHSRTMPCYSLHLSQENPRFFSVLLLFPLQKVISDISLYKEQLRWLRTKNEMVLLRNKTNRWCAYSCGFVSIFHFFSFFCVCSVRCSATWEPPLNVPSFDLRSPPTTSLWMRSSIFLFCRCLRQPTFRRL